jgi:hypothetical protein
MYRRGVAGLLMAAGLLMGTLGVERASAQPVGSAITYQGELRQNGAPVGGPVNLSFQLFNAAIGGAQVGPTVFANNTATSGGRFTVQLDFGAGAFAPGEQRWVAITANGVLLSPRQPITAAPFSQYSSSPFTLSGTTAFYNGGLVGIGTQFPSHRLTVENAANEDVFRLISGGIFGSGSRFNFGDADYVYIDEDIDDSLRISVAGRLALMSEVGINTLAPAAQLHVVGTTIFDGAAYWYNGNRSYYRFNTTDGRGNINSDSIDINIWPTGGNNRLYVGGNAIVTGNFSVLGSKSFVQEHPTRPDTALVNYCLEGLTSDVYQRGTAQLAGGRAVISLPEEFTALASGEISVSLTPRGDCRGLFVPEPTLSTRGFEVRELMGGNGNARFDYVVYAQRRHFEDAPTSRAITMKEKVGLSRVLSEQQKVELSALLPLDESRVAPATREAFLRAMHTGNIAGARSIAQQFPESEIAPPLVPVIVPEPAIQKTQPVASR